MSASAPWLYSPWRVTAAAVPEGNLSFSRLIIDRFIGIARTTPSAARKKIHMATCCQRMFVPPGDSGVTVRRSIAGSAVIVRKPVAYPADDAVETAQVVSRIERRPLTSPAPCSVLQIA